MIQDVSNRQSKPTPQISPMAIQPWSFDSKAHELMDEVFSELERLIDNGGKLPTQTAQTKSTPSEHFPEDVFELTQAHPQENIPEIPPPDSQPTSTSSQITKVELSEITPLDTSESELTTSEEPEILTPILERHQNSGQFLDKILFVIALSSLVGVIWWLAEQAKLQFAFLQNLMGKPVATHKEISQSNSQFIEYMQRSLKVLHNQQKESEEKQNIQPDLG